MRRVLTIMDRAGIAKGLGEGHSLREIARRIGRDVSVVSREVAQNRGVWRVNRLRHRASRSDAGIADLGPGNKDGWMLPSHPRLPHPTRSLPKSTCCFHHMAPKGGWAPPSVNYCCSGHRNDQTHDELAINHSRP